VPSRAVDQGEADRGQKKLSKGAFDLEDFLSSMKADAATCTHQPDSRHVTGMGQLAKAGDLVNEKELRRVEAIILAMTPGERRNPDIIKGSRKERIAKEWHVDRTGLGVAQKLPADATGNEAVRRQNQQPHA
jgi:signal recognition particle subunit SRP54